MSSVTEASCSIQVWLKIAGIQLLLYLHLYIYLYYLRIFKDTNLEVVFQSFFFFLH